MKKIILAGLLAGVAMLIINVVLSLVFNLIFPQLAGEYNNTGLFRPWSDPLMSLMYAHPFILGLLLAWVWSKVKNVITGQNIWKKALGFGLSFWAVSSIPGMFITYSSFPVSIIMVITWSLSGLIQIYFASVIFAKFIK